MTEHTYPTPQGSIHYWVQHTDAARPTLVFLPGLTADHRLFDKQIEAFSARFDLLVWDAPGHGASRPFALDFTLADKATWLHDILEKENIQKFVLIGQSMGGYVAQCFLQKYPGTAAAFVSIDSAPLQRKYMTAAEIWMLRRTEPMFKLYPWGLLLRAVADGCAVTASGRTLMREMAQGYSKAEYCALSAHGYCILADAIAADMPYEIDCPALLICGVHDAAGETKKYNRAWAKATGLPIHWVAGAGHNSNTDQPETVNGYILSFLEEHIPTTAK